MFEDIIGYVGNECENVHNRRDDERCLAFVLDLLEEARIAHTLLLLELERGFDTGIAVAFHI